MNADGSAQNPLANLLDDNNNPAWSPDGTKIAYDSMRDGNRDIYVMNADFTTGETRLTTDPAEDEHPTWSPDGRKIAFASWRIGGVWSEIYTMYADGSNQTRLTFLPCCDPPIQHLNYYPAWAQ